MDELAFLTQRGMDRSQLELMYDYRTNVASYPQWQAYLREHRSPTLVAWGKRDSLFTVSGALAFGRENPDAEMHLLDAGHFAMEGANAGRPEDCSRDRPDHSAPLPSIAAVPGALAH
jgi:pimeloyl-ACP methyl ester carboxylesterase